MADPDIQRYLDDIESQHRTPRFIQHLTDILEMIDSAHGVAKDVPFYFYVMNAVGNQLDTIARYVGADRRFPPVTIPGFAPLLTDDMLRIAILAKILQNQWDGTNSTFREIWKTTLGDRFDISYHDNQDMTVDMQFIGDTEPIITELILHGYIVPKPMGVGMNITLIQNTIMDGHSRYADAEAYSNSLHGVINNHLDVTTEDEAAFYYGSIAPFNSAKVTLLNHIEYSTEAEDSMRRGCCMPANSARVTVRVT